MTLSVGIKYSTGDPVCDADYCTVSRNAALWVIMCVFLLSSYLGRYVFFSRHNDIGVCSFAVISSRLSRSVIECFLHILYNNCDIVQYEGAKTKRSICVVGFISDR